MAKEAMDDFAFDRLLASINMETSKPDKKLDILFTSRGYFSALQASRILFALGNPPDKVKAIQIMEPRLTRMTCSEARDMISGVSIQNDKLKCLESIKRALVDCQSREGVEMILSAFPFESDKMRAMHILGTVRSDVFDKIPAGGHQGYAALGGLYTQSRPLVPHLYGPVDYQQTLQPGKGDINVTVESRQGVVPSMYTGHPSYAYPQGRDYALDRGYPGGTSNVGQEWPSQGIDKTGCTFQC